jgi:hypothetical protein
VCEGLLPEGDDPPRHVVMTDLQLLVLLGGRKRSRTEFERLFASTGFELRRCVAEKAPGVLEATPVDAPRDSAARV